MAEPTHDPRDDYDDRLSFERTASAPSKPVPRMNPWIRGLFFGVLAALSVAAYVTVSQNSVRPAVNRIKSSNNLKIIGLGMHNYNDAYGELPHNTYTPDGKPLLSWRVHLLPFVEEEGLYQQFNLDEPWDSPNNIRLLPAKPRLYLEPGDLKGKRGPFTSYRGFSNPGAVFERRPGDVPRERLYFFSLRVHPPERFGIASIQDGTSNTIFVVEAGDAVEWTKPDDLDASPGKPFPKMGGFGWRSGFQAAMGDGSVRTFKPDTPEDKLRALISHSGGEAETPD
jgi:hypothetical protein